MSGLVTALVSCPVRTSEVLFQWRPLRSSVHIAAILALEMGVFLFSVALQPPSTLGVLALLVGALFCRAVMLYRCLKALCW
uniref:Uncharacterized protein n=1 Tax=Manihot esculenta TaxID=3983 RepID=A0A2C9URF6_MANES